MAEGGFVSVRQAPDEKGQQARQEWPLQLQSLHTQLDRYIQSRGWKLPSKFQALDAMQNRAQFDAGVVGSRYEGQLGLRRQIWADLVRSARLFFG
jgi:hypothetical protein